MPETKVERPDIEGNLDCLKRRGEGRGPISRSYVEIAEYALQLEKECDQLRAFAQAITDTWPLGANSNEIVEAAAINHGLLEERVVTEPCNGDEGCICAEVGFPTTCNFKTPLLTGKEPG